MAKIKIVKEFRGQGMLQLLDRPWEILTKLETGIFTESATTIELQTTTGEVLTVDKTYISEEDSKKITYPGIMNYSTEPFHLFVDKLKSKESYYIVRGFFPNGFSVEFTTNENYKSLPKLPFEIDNIQFHSNNHIRYQNGQVAISSSTDNEGHNKDANRGIQIEPNINGDEGYTVTIFNMDGNHPLWGNNVQMAPKQMKLISVDNEKIILQGYGLDSMGGSFADYGLTIYHNGLEVTKLKLHMFDRKVDIEYLKSNVQIKQEPEIVKLAKQASLLYENDNVREAVDIAIQIYRQIKFSPAQLGDVTNFEDLGKAFVIMLNHKISSDIDTLQMIASVGYLCISKAIENDKRNLNLYKDRLFLLILGHEPFKYTVMSALNLNSGGFSSFSMGSSNIEARDAIYKMEISDIEQNPILCRQYDIFQERRIQFEEKISRDFFRPDRTKEEVIKSGLENHARLLEYLENRVINEEDVDF